MSTPPFAFRPTEDDTARFEALRKYLIDNDLVERETTDADVFRFALRYTVNDLKLPVPDTTSE